MGVVPPFPIPDAPWTTPLDTRELETTEILGWVASGVDARISGIRA